MMFYISPNKKKIELEWAESYFQSYFLSKMRDFIFSSMCESVTKNAEVFHFHLMMKILQLTSKDGVWKETLQ